MSKIDRLDFSAPPDGYDVGYFEGWWWSLSGSKRTSNENALASKVDALTAAWAHYKARHDPPGMNLLGGFFCSPHTNPKASEARAAAWSWYEDAVEVADLLDGENGPSETWPDRCAWPRPLTWTAEQRTEVRLWASWTSQPPFLPEVLRGL